MANQDGTDNGGSTPLDVDALVGAAQEVGVGDAAAKAARNELDSGADLGVPADQIESNAVVVASIVLDDSGSMQGTEKMVCTAYNGMLERIKRDRGRDEVLLARMLLHDWKKVGHAPVRIDDAPYLNPREFVPDGGTPLYRKTVAILGQVTAKVGELAQSGRTARSITVLISDGNNADDSFAEPVSIGNVAAVVADMLATKQHIVAGVAIGGSAAQTFKDMGIPANWIISPDHSESGLNATFRMISKASAGASKGAGAFATVQRGGFRDE